MEPEATSARFQSSRRSTIIPWARGEEVNRLSAEYHAIPASHQVGFANANSTSPTKAHIPAAHGLKVSKKAQCLQQNDFSQGQAI